MRKYLRSGLVVSFVLLLCSVRCNGESSAGSTHGLFLTLFCLIPTELCEEQVTQCSPRVSLTSLFSTSKTFVVSCSPEYPFSPWLPPPGFSELVHRSFQVRPLGWCLWDHLRGQRKSEDSCKDASNLNNRSKAVRLGGTSAQHGDRFTRPMCLRV